MLFPIAICHLWGISKPPFIWLGLILSLESFWLAQSPAKCPGPKKKSCPAGSPKRCEEGGSQGSMQQTALCSILPSRGCGEGLQQQGDSPGSSSDGQAGQMVLGPGTIQDTPSPQTKKRQYKGGLQGKGTFHPAYGSGREMETRRWKGSPTLEGLQNLAQCGEVSGLLCACPTKTNPPSENSSPCDRGEKWTEKSLHNLLNICLSLMDINMIFRRRD